MKHLFLAVIAISLIATSMSPFLTSCVKSEAMTVVSPNGKISVNLKKYKTGYAGSRRYCYSNYL